MDINRVNGLNGVNAARQANSVNRNNVAGNRHVVARDEMQISNQSAAKAADTVTTVTLNSNEVRLDLVNRIREEIAAGTYYTDEKFEAAMNRMFDSFDFE